MRILKQVIHSSTYITLSSSFLAIITPIVAMYNILNNSIPRKQKTLFRRQSEIQNILVSNQ
jgi:hypothetical protein